MTDEKGQTSKRLVIDADVAQAAGGEGAKPGASICCRDFLLAALKICHRVVMTGPIRAEWEKHQSSMAITWLTSMEQHDKIVDVEPSENDELRRAVSQVATNKGEQENILDDMHIVEAAMVTDGVAVSLDDRARRAFSRLATERKEIQNIVWVNPVEESEIVIAWLEGGAKAEKGRTLGSFT